MIEQKKTTKQIGQKEEERKRTEKKELKGSETGPALPGGSWKEEQLKPGKFPHQQGDQQKKI